MKFHMFRKNYFSFKMFNCSKVCCLKTFNWYSRQLAYQSYELCHV
jgi:hypothetical protein